jgi:hypothetical protein
MELRVWTIDEKRYFSYNKKEKWKLAGKYSAGF